MLIKTVQKIRYHDPRINLIVFVESWLDFAYAEPLLSFDEDYWYNLGDFVCQPPEFAKFDFFKRARRCN